LDEWRRTGEGIGKSHPFATLMEEPGDRLVRILVIVLIDVREVRVAGISDHDKRHSARFEGGVEFQVGLFGVNAAAIAGGRSDELFKFSCVDVALRRREYEHAVLVGGGCLNEAHDFGESTRASPVLGGVGSGDGQLHGTPCD